VLFQGVMLTPISVLFQGVMQVERRLGGRLLDHPKQIPFQDGGHNLCLTIEDLNAGWRSKLAANYQVRCTGSLVTNFKVLFGLILIISCQEPDSLAVLYILKLAVNKQLRKKVSSVSKFESF